MAYVDLGWAKDILFSKSGMCIHNAVRREGYCLVPRNPNVTALSPDGERQKAETLERLRIAGLKLSSMESRAIECKRDGDLETANTLYSILCLCEDVYDKSYLWGWIKVLLLAKNFDAADIVLWYLYCFNARFNLLRMADGESLSDYAAWGSTPPTDFDSYNAGRYLRQVSDKSFSSWKGAEADIRGYGGSDYWNRNFYLSQSEYQEFCRVF